MSFGAAACQRVTGLLLTLSLAVFCLAQPTVRVGLYDFPPSGKVQCQTLSGSFDWTLPDGTVLAPLSGLQTIGPSAAGIALESGIAGNYPYLILRPTSSGSRLRMVSAATGYRQYEGAVHFLKQPDGMLVVLEISVDSYLSGVLATEVGKGHAEALYEAHAIISRTYTAQNKMRHRMRGFDVCDQVHCQVFKGLSTVNDTLSSASERTSGVMLVDRLGRPATAAFHSNCGGQTKDAADVWSSALPYLVSVPDSACTGGQHAQWRRTLPMSDWQEFLGTHANRPVAGTVSIQVLARSQFKLPSATFTISEQPERSEVTLHGRGFGHGVGLCQEGAMQRAADGQSAWQILSHYYPGVRLVDGWKAE